MIRVYTLEYIRERKLHARSFSSKTIALARAKEVLGPDVPTSTVWVYGYDGTPGEALAAAMDKPNSWWTEARVVRVLKAKNQKESTNDEA